MSHEFYKIAHVIGLLLLFSALALAFLGPRTETGKAPRSAMMLHGLGMIVVFVAGFGLLARNGIGWPWPGWVIVKLGIWIVLGALPVLVSKKIVPAKFAWLLALVAAGAAAWLALTRPWQ